MKTNYQFNNDYNFEESYKKASSIFKIINWCKFKEARNKKDKEIYPFIEVTKNMIEILQINHVCTQIVIDEIELRDMIVTDEICLWANIKPGDILVALEEPFFEVYNKDFFLKEFEVV